VRPSTERRAPIAAPCAGHPWLSRGSRSDETAVRRLAYPRGISTRPSKDLSPRPSRDHPQAASRRRAARLKQRVRAGAQLILPHLRCRKDLWRRFARGAQGALEARPAEGQPGVLGSGVKCQRWPVASMCGGLMAVWRREGRRQQHSGANEISLAGHHHVTRFLTLGGRGHCARAVTYRNIPTTPHTRML